MKVWIYAALCLGIFGAIGHLTKGDGEAAAESMMTGLGLVVVVVVVGSIIAGFKLLTSKRK